jgi:hypothetical protein
MEAMRQHPKALTPVPLVATAAHCNSMEAMQPWRHMISPALQVATRVHFSSMDPWQRMINSVPWVISSIRRIGMWQ